jgi:predicted ATPase/predicted Ser/Thr protein kinase
MTPERYQRIGELYEAALKVEAGRRNEFLCRACSGDERLQREVEALLAAGEKADSFMEKSALDISKELMGSLPTPAPAQRQFGHYQVLSLLGRGGMGEVYLAQDTKLGRKVAIKLLPAEYTLNPERVRRFEQEARAASSLNHPNIITIHEIGSTGDGRFMVMEFVEGQTLRSMIGTPLPLRQRLDIARQVAQALRVAHAAGIVHRDIKPENIMVRSDGYVKVLDFGIARLLTGSEGATATDPGIVIGTPRYMSPEQMRGEAAASPSDVYSLGLVLYELVTGQYSGAQLQTPPSRLSKEVSDVVEGLILRMLHQNAGLRPSAAAVEAVLAEPIVRVSVLKSSSHTVGREKESTRLHAALQSVAAGRGLVLCVSGEPGIGKTTLVEDFLQELDAENTCRVARGRCSERLAGAEAYLPWLEAIDSLLHGPAGGTVSQVLRAIGPSWYSQVASTESGSSGRSQAGSQERMKRELVAFLQEISRLQPLVVFFDDVHWSDASTVDLLAYAATKFETLRVLVVATYRPSDLLLAKHPFFQLKTELQGRRLCQEIPLDFLSRTDIEHYLDLECPQNLFGRELPALIYDKTEGSPIFMTDLVRYLRNEKVIAEIDGRWTLARSVPEIQADLPESVRAMISRKITQLPEDDRRLLIAASVQGYEFDSAVVSHALGVDAAELEDRMESLEHIFGFVRMIETKEFPDRTLTVRYRFVHVLYQNALYALLRPTRKTQLSGSVARALLGIYGEQRGAVASELAKLFEAARDFSRALEYYLLAAKNAASVFAYHETITLANAGCSLLRTLPESRERDQQELDLQLFLGPALIAIKGFAVPEVEQVYARAHDLCRPLDAKSQLSTVLYNQWVVHDLKGEIKVALQLAEQFLEMAQRSQDSGLLVMGYEMCGEVLSMAGEFRSAQPYLEKARSLYVPEQHHSLTVLHGGYDQGVMTTLMEAHDFWYLGYPERGLNKLREAVALSQALGHAQTTALALIHASLHYYLRRETDHVSQSAEAALSVSNEHDLRFYVAYAMNFHGSVLVKQGRTHEGIAEMRKGIADYLTTGSRSERSWFAAALADALRISGLVAEGIQVLDEILAEVDRLECRYHEAELNRLKGELLLEFPNANEADVEACFQRAVAISRRQSAKSLELRATTSLCLLWQRQGKYQQARAMLAPICEWFTEGLDTADLRDAKALLEGLDYRSGSA